MFRCICEDIRISVIAGIVVWVVYVSVSLLSGNKPSDIMQLLVFGSSIAIVLVGQVIDTISGKHGTDC